MEYSIPINILIVNKIGCKVVNVINSLVLFLCLCPDSLLGLTDIRYRDLMDLSAFFFHH